MNRIVSDASRRVRELKRQKTKQEEEEDDEIRSIGHAPTSRMKMGADCNELVSKQLDLSSIGDAFDWSPKASPKQKKKRGFVRLSSYDNQCFASSSVNNNGMQKQNSAFVSPAKSSRNVL